MGNEPTKNGTGDQKNGTGDQTMAEFANAISSFINPLAERQAQAQIEAIRTDERKFMRAMDERGQESKRQFWFSVMALAILTATVMVLIFVFNSPDPALYALTYMGGAVSGYGLAIGKTLVQQRYAGK